MFSAALCRGLIEACAARPRRRGRDTFSAALCRGLIEAPLLDALESGSTASFPRLYAAASLKPVAPAVDRLGHAAVFRGFMPRPH